MRTTATLLSVWDDYSSGCIPIENFLSKLNTFKNPKGLIEPQDYFQDRFSDLVTVQNQHRYERKSQKRVACTFKWPSSQNEKQYKLPVMKLPKVKNKTKIRRFKSLERLGEENTRIKASDCALTKRIDIHGLKSNISLKLKNPLFERKKGNLFFAKNQKIGNGNANSRSTSSLPRIELQAGRIIQDRLQLKKTFLLDSKRFLLKETLKKSKEKNPKFLQNLKKRPKQTKNKSCNTSKLDGTLKYE